MLSIADAILVMVTCFIMVFLVLAGLMVVTMAFKYIFKEEAVEPAPAAQSIVPSSHTTSSPPLNQDPQMIAAMTALIVANEEETDKTYTVTSVKRVKRE